MTGSGVTADVAGLAQTASQFQGVADQMAAALERLAQSLQGEPTAIGPDASGQAIGNKYVPAADGFWQHAGIAAKNGLPNLGGTMSTWVQSYATEIANELAAATQFNGNVNAAT